MKFKGDIILVDPCSVVRCNDDWQKCGWGADMAAIGLEYCLYLDAGDESCGAVKNADTGEILGHFCTDSCALILTDMAEILRYNPDFRDHEKYPDSCTVIRGFDGEVTMENGRFAGQGSVNFVTEPKA